MWEQGSLDCPLEGSVGTYLSQSGEQGCPLGARGLVFGAGSAQGGHGEELGLHGHQLCWENPS